MDAVTVCRDVPSFVAPRLLRAGHPRGWRWSVLPVCFLLTVVGGTLSCVGDTTTGPGLPDAAHAYWALQLNQHAVNMATVAPYNTVQLLATPLTAAGTPLTGFGHARFTPLDSAVTVDSTGLVTAHYVTPPSGKTWVIASLQDRTLNATHTDTVYIQVTDTVPRHPLATFSLQPESDDSAKRALQVAQLGFSWSARANDAAGTTVCDTSACALQVFYTSSAPQIAEINPRTGEVTANDTGNVVFTATALVYGVAEHDSVLFRVGYYTAFRIDVVLAVLLGVLTLGFVAPKKLILGVGAVVTFCDKSPQPVDVVFDQPAAVDTASCLGSYGQPTGSSNIEAFGGVFTVETTATPPDTIYGSSNMQYLPNCASRRFTAPGIYHYHSSLFPSNSYEIDVKAEQ